MQCFRLTRNKRYQSIAIKIPNVNFLIDIPPRYLMKRSQYIFDVLWVFKLCFLFTIFDILHNFYDMARKRSRRKSKQSQQALQSQPEPETNKPDEINVDAQESVEAAPKANENTQSKSKAYFLTISRVPNNSFSKVCIIMLITLKLNNSLTITYSLA